MHVVLRLQNHGCKRHPLWWIVAAPKKRNIRGRIIEHLGYWIPHEKKQVQRSVILNKPRIKYWLAMGAIPTSKIHRFASWANLLPPPLIKYGSKTLYDRPSKNVVKKYSVRDKLYLDRVLEQEEKNTLKRQILYQQGKIAELPPNVAELEEQWDKLRAELYQIEKDTKVVDPLKREQLFGKMNQIASMWQKERTLTKEIVDNSQTTDQNIKQKLLLQSLLEEQNKALQEKLSWFQDLQPLTQKEVVEYLLQYTGREDVAMDQCNAIYQYAMDTSQAVTKTLVDEFIRNEFDQVQMVDLVHQYPLKKNDMDEIEYIPVSKPVHPLPDFDAYDPSEYTDIQRESERLIKNKSFSIPNVDLEGNLDSYPDDVQMNLSRTNMKKGRSVNERNRFHVPRNTRNVKLAYSKKRK